MCFSLGILSGIVIIPGTAGGIFLGSYLIKRVDVRSSCKIAAKYCFIFQFIGTWAVLTFLIPGCKTTLLAGISQPYNNRYIKPLLSKFVLSLITSIHLFLILLQRIGSSSSSHLLFDVFLYYHLLSVLQCSS